MDLDVDVDVHGKKGYTVKKAEEGSVGYDIYTPQDIVMPFNSRFVLDTGLIVRPSEKVFSLVVPRSSMGTSKASSVRIANTVGVIDPSYCGSDDTIKITLEREDRKYNKKYEFKQSEKKGWLRAYYFAYKTTDISIFDLKLVKGQSDGKKRKWYVYEREEKDTLIYNEGSRFCQILFIPYSRPDILEKSIEKFSESNRGGYGSTGMK